MPPGVKQNPVTRGGNRAVTQRQSRGRPQEGNERSRSLAPRIGPFHRCSTPLPAVDYSLVSVVPSIPLWPLLDQTRKSRLALPIDHHGTRLCGLRHTRSAASRHASPGAGTRRDGTNHAARISWGGSVNIFPRHRSGGVATTQKARRTRVRRAFRISLAKGPSCGASRGCPRLG